MRRRVGPDSTTAQFPLQQLGLGDGLYGFEAIAINSAGQREPQHFVAEASLIVDLADQVRLRAHLPLMLEQANLLVARADTVEETEKAEAAESEIDKVVPQEVEVIDLAP